MRSAVAIASLGLVALDAPPSCYAFVAPAASLTSLRPSSLTIAGNERHDSSRIRNDTQRRPASPLRAQGAMELTGMVSDSRQMAADASSAVQYAVSSLLLSAGGDVAPQAPPPPPPPSAEALSNTTNVAVFVIGLIPFAWATVEFWRRIAVGATFGTGRDSVVIPRPQDVLLEDEDEDENGGSPSLITIGEDNNPSSSRGRQVLGKDALLVAYLLFGIAAASVGIAVYSVLTAPPMP